MQFLANLFLIWETIKKSLTRKKNKLVYNIDWKFKEIDISGEEITGIELLTGIYKGLVYFYNSVKISENDADGAKVSFSYSIYHNPTNSIDYSIFNNIAIEILDTTLNERPDVESVVADEFFKGQDDFTKEL